MGYGQGWFRIPLYFLAAGFPSLIIRAMNKILFAASGTFLLVVFLGSQVVKGTLPEKTGARIWTAARDLLASLDEKSKSKAVFDFRDEERFNWHFIPRKRKGISLKELKNGPRDGVLGLLRAGLSKTGARKAGDVMVLEEILGKIEGRPSSRDPTAYYISFFAEPTRDGLWGWRFEGHHISLNFTLKGDRVISFTPAFLGANPALVRDGPRKGFRMLGGVEDLARDLVTSLSPEELEACLKAPGGEVPREVPGAGTSRYPGPYPRGVLAESLSSQKQEKLRKLILEYVENFPEDLTGAIGKGSLRGVHFAWRGQLEPFQPHCYLIHGPRFVINYSNVQNGAAHVHSCFRLKGEFGLPERSKEGD